MLDPEKCAVVLRRKIMGGGKITGASFPPNSKPFPGFRPNESLFRGPVLQQQRGPLAGSLQGPNVQGPNVLGPNAQAPNLRGQRTMPGGPIMPNNPCPELGRKLVRWNGF
jgi:hypothetical protein